MGGIFSGEYRKPTVESKHFGALFEEMPSMEGKTVVVTGTTSGTGLCLAENLARKGARVVMLNRPSERATNALARVQEAAASPDLIVHVDCDLMNFDSVRTAAATVNAQETGIGAKHILRFTIASVQQMGLTLLCIYLLTIRCSCEQCWNYGHCRSCYPRRIRSPNAD